VSLANSVVAGYGADTITINSAAAGIATVGFSVAANQGNDLISISAGGILNSAFVGGGLGVDTITVQTITQYINSNIKGGDNGDSITIVGGALTNTMVEGNKGADTISVNTTAASSGSVGGGEGHDTITIGAGAVATWINGGAGLDSISIAAGASFSTLAGGGLADTISFGGAFAGGVIYGDGIGVTTSGTGTGGTADGADLIANMAAAITAAATIYGAGGEDTIAFADVTDTGNGVFVDGGNGADSIVFADLNHANTARTTVLGGLGGDTIAIATADTGVLAGGGDGNDSISIAAVSQLSIGGGAGNDTIKFQINAAAATIADVVGGDNNDLIQVGITGLAILEGNGLHSVFGGNGADTIALKGVLNAAGANKSASIDGGAGNDSILISDISAGFFGDFTAVSTINGGAGTDTIFFTTTAGGALIQDSGITAGIANVVYEAGDIIQLNATAFTALAGAAANGLVNIGSSAGSFTAANTVTAAGQISVYSDGTDTFFAIAVGADSGLAFRVTGKDLVNTTGVGLFAQSAVGFTFTATSGTGVTITLA